MLGKLILTLERDFLQVHPQLVTTLERKYNVVLNLEVRLTEQRLRNLWQTRHLEGLVIGGNLVTPGQLASLPGRDFALILINAPYTLPDSMSKDPLSVLINCRQENLDLRLWGNGERYVELLCSILAGLYSCLDVQLDSCSFTEKEREVLTMLLQGLKDDHIARTLYISPKTVRNHISNMLRKVGVESRTQLVLWAMQRGLKN